jgi:hypothetical protein
VCWRLVARTMNARIEDHWDSIGLDPCLGGREPYRITIATSYTTGDQHRAARFLRRTA